MQRLIINFQPRLAEPDVSLEVGVLRLGAGGCFQSFEWTVNVEALRLDPVTAQAFRLFPQSLRVMVPQISGEDVGLEVLRTLRCAMLCVSRVEIEPTHLT